jgi:hypothetical protein
MSGLPDVEALRRMLSELTHPDLPEDADQLARLAAVAVTRQAWRDTHLEDLHAGDHPSGGFPDEDMMRFNIATTRLVAEHLRTDPTDWQALADAIADPERELPDGITVAELAGDEYDKLADDIYRQVNTFAVIEEDHGRVHTQTMLAMLGAQMNREWYGTPWWPQLVEVFIEWLDDPDSEAWEYADPLQPEPASVRDRAALKTTLIAKPEALDDDGIRWCWTHRLDAAANPGVERWRAQRSSDGA